MQTYVFFYNVCVCVCVLVQSVAMSTARRNAPNDICASVARMKIQLQIRGWFLIPVDRSARED